MGGPFRAWAQITEDYLLPQVVGETSGMRGREPPVIHRVETFDTCVARGNLQLSATPTGRVLFLENQDTVVWLLGNWSRIRASNDRVGFGITRTRKRAVGA
jgi:hypothetical protein